jgi:hypothetical protein
MEPGGAETLRDREQFTLELLDMIRDGWRDGIVPVLILSTDDGSACGIVSPFADRADLMSLLDHCCRKIANHEGFRFGVKP